MREDIEQLKSFVVDVHFMLLALQTFVELATIAPSFFAHLL